jgi:hypothetical protein
MPEKLMRCIKHVKEASANRRKKVNPYAVCVASTGLKMEPRGKKKK